MCYGIPADDRGCRDGKLKHTSLKFSSIPAYFMGGKILLSLYRASKNFLCGQKTLE
jgi:hypothetical protein